MRAGARGAKGVKAPTLFKDGGTFLLATGPYRKKKKKKKKKNSYYYSSYRTTHQLWGT